MIRSDVMPLEQVRAWFGRPLWEWEPADADTYFGTARRTAAKNPGLARAQAPTACLVFLELRHTVAIHQMTGRDAERPIDEMNWPCGHQRAALRIPPRRRAGRAIVHRVATGRAVLPDARSDRSHLRSGRTDRRCRAPVDEARSLDLADLTVDLGRSGTPHVQPR
jgi:integrase/recombinase XerD